jgi:hypothetical protein
VAESVYSSDDRAAMTWLREHARPGEIVANDAAADAGIWTPYLAEVPVLLPRSSEGPQRADREALLSRLTDPAAAVPSDQACDPRVGYVFHGARVYTPDDQVMPSTSILEHAPALEEAFRSGDAAVFRTRLACP